MNKKILGLGILLATLISFFGFAAAATISDASSNTHHASTSYKYVNNRYITGSTDKLTSNINFKSTPKTYTSKDWINETTAIQTMGLLNGSKTTIKKLKTQQNYSKSSKTSPETISIKINTKRLSL